MLKSETGRVFFNRSVVGFIVFVILLNFLQMHYLQNKNIDDNGLSGYRAVWKQAEAKYAAEGDEGAREWLASQSETWGEDKSVYNYVLSEYEKILGYDIYLEELIEYSKRITGVSIFADKESFSYRNIRSMMGHYEAMRGTTPYPSPSLGFESATNSGITDIIAVVTIIYICVFVWLRDKEDNNLVLIRTTPVGRTTLVFSKLFMLTVFVFLLNIFLNGVNLLVGEAVYGLGELGREIVSVLGYRSTVLKITAGEYLVLFMACKFASYMAAMLLVSALFCCSRSSLTGFGGVLVAVGAGAGFYYLIPRSSVWMVFKYMNLYGLMRTEDYLGNYINLNFFKNPVPLWICAVLLCVVLLTVGTVITIKWFVRIRGQVKLPRLLLKAQGIYVRFTNKTIKHVSAFWHEQQKIFLTQGVLVILVLLACLQVWRADTIKASYKGDVGYYYSIYMRQLEGPVDESKKEYLLAEKKTVEDKMQKQAVDKALKKIAYLEESGGYILYEGGWEEITAGIWHRPDLLNVAFLTVGLVLTLSAIFSTDKQYGIYRLITTTPKGRHLLQVIRLVTGLVISFAVFFLTYYFQTVKIWEKNRLTKEMLSYPACSLEHLSRFGTEFTLGEYLVLLTLVRLFALVVGGCLIHFVAGRLGSVSRTYIVMTIVLVMPAVMVMENMHMLGAYYPWSLFAGNLALTYPMQKFVPLVVCYFIVLCFGIYSACHKKRT